MQARILAALVISTICASTITAVCLPHQLKECIARQEAKKEEEKTKSTNSEESEDLELLDENELENRSIRNNKPCFSQRGFFGVCRLPKSCDAEASYSNTCGRYFGCCNQSKVSSSKQKTIRRRVINRRLSSHPRNETVKPEECGTSDLSKFVHGGKIAEEGQFPFLVSFVNVIRAGYIDNFCGGVIITRRHILTAAHCLDTITEDEITDGKIDVRIGAVNILSREKFRNRAEIEEIIIHEQYRKSAVRFVNPVNDIAIVRLARDVTSSKVVPVCLPETGFQPQATVAGWGSTEFSTKSVSQLRYARIKIFEPSECKAAYAAVTSLVSITDNMLCAGDQIVDTCNGDSGGPLLWYENGRYVVGGIVSFGPKSCAHTIPGVFTKVKNYLDWIRKNTDDYL